MTTTRKAIAKAEELRISQIGDFKKRLGGIIELPSGLVVKVRNPGGLQAFMSSGIIPNSLMLIIQAGIKSGKAPEAGDILDDEGGMNPEMLADMNIMVDQLAMKTIIEPRIHPAPEDEDDRLDDQLYVDELPSDDKQFIFQWIAGGTKDLERFRETLAGNVDAVATESSRRATAK